MMASGQASQAFDTAASVIIVAQDSKILCRENVVSRGDNVRTP